MLKKIIIFMLIIYPITHAYAWPWDPPEKKARIYISELGEIAKKAINIEEIGWNRRARQIIKSLQKLGNPAVQPTINEMLDKDNDWKFRFISIDLLYNIEGLGKAEGKKIIQSYVKMLVDDREETTLRGRVADAFGRIGVTLEAKIQTEKKAKVELSPHPWPELLSSEERKNIVDTLIALLLDEKSPNSVRVHSIRALSTYYDFAVVIANSIATLLNSSNVQIRTTTVNSLGGIAMMAEREHIGEILVGELKKGKSDFPSNQVLFWIKGLEIREAIPFLLESLKTEKYCSKRDATEILGKWKVEEAVHDLIQLLKKGRSSERYKAAEALGNIGSKEAVEPLIEVLREGGDLAEKAAAALGKIGDTRAIEPIMEVFQNMEKYNIRASEELPMALMVLGVRDAIPLIEEKYNELQKKYANKTIWRAVYENLQRFKEGEIIEYPREKR